VKMGWDFGVGYSKADVIKENTAPSENEKYKSITLAHSVRGNVLWSVREVTHKGGNTPGKVERHILCDLLGKNDGDWGYKGMDESMGPYYYSCPLPYLDMVPQVADANWREKVREYHRKQARTFTVGETITFISGTRPPELTITSLRPFKGVYNGITYSIPKRLIL